LGGTHDALGVLEVAKDTWPLGVLRLPLGAGEVVCVVEESELLVRLHELGTNGRFSNAILPIQRAFLIIDIMPPYRLDGGSRLIYRSA